MSSCHIDASLQDQYTLNCSLFRSAKPLKWDVKGYWNIKNHFAWWIFSKHRKSKWQKGKTNIMCCMYLAYFPISQVVSDTRPINWLREMWSECRYRIEEIVYQYSNEHLKSTSNKNKVTENVITERNLRVLKLFGVLKVTLTSPQLYESRDTFGPSGDNILHSWISTFVKFHIETSSMRVHMNKGWWDILTTIEFGNWKGRCEELTPRWIRCFLYYFAIRCSQSGQNMHQSHNIGPNKSPWQIAMWCK
jgi:hypothetical protein